VLLKRAATVELDWDTRQKSRFDAEDSQGRALGVFLPRGAVVRGGDVLVAEDGTLVRVVARAQPVLVVQACAEHGAPFELLRAAYHLGNRHVALELQRDRLQLEPDHVLAQMLRQMHLVVSEAQAPFEPEAGAYAARGMRRTPTTLPCPDPGPDHDPGHDHGHVHGPGLRPRALSTSPASLLQLIWLASPALPVGGFSYSEGLEAAVEAGLVGGETQAAQWLADQLRLGPARSEIAVVHLALHAWRQRRRRPAAAAQRLVHADPRDPRAAPAGAADGPLAGRVAEEPRPRRCAGRAAGGVRARADLAGRVRAGRSAERRRAARRAVRVCASAGPRTWCRRR
jgi:urease accessory protein